MAPSAAGTPRAAAVLSIGDGAAASSAATVAPKEAKLTRTIM